MHKTTNSFPPRVNPLRATTWRLLLKAQRSGFLAWINSTGVRYKAFDRLASALEILLLNHLLIGDSEISVVESCTRFANAIPIVFSACDYAIYEDPFVAEAYAFVHLLERYHRATTILEELLKAGILPMRDDGITVLDVGSGPGASAFATRDFYAHLAQYAESHEVTGLKTPPPVIYPVESSSRMVHVMHWISELSGRSGPFFRKFENFNGLDFRQLRLGVRDAAIKALTDDGEDWGTIPNLLDWQDQLRFNLGIFSYFLTQEKTVSEATQALTSLFQSMRAGGVVVTAGGVAGRYRRVYKKLGKIARPELMERIKAVPPRLPTSTDEYSARMKAVYERVWRRLESSVPNLEPIKAKLPRDLWDSEVPLKWAPWFGVRVFRRMDIKPERHSWHKNKIARERRTKNVPKQ